MPLKQSASLIAALPLFALAIAAGTHGYPTSAGLLVFSSASAVILALLRPRDAKVCRICGNRKVTPQPLCFSCRQRFGVDE